MEPRVVPDPEGRALLCRPEPASARALQLVEGVCRLCAGDHAATGPERQDRTALPCRAAQPLADHGRIHRSARTDAGMEQRIRSHQARHLARPVLVRRAAGGPAIHDLGTQPSAGRRLARLLERAQTRALRPAAELPAVFRLRTGIREHAAGGAGAAAILTALPGRLQRGAGCLRARQSGSRGAAARPGPQSWHRRGRGRFPFATASSFSATCSGAR